MARSSHRPIGFPSRPTGGTVLLQPCRNTLLYRPQRLVQRPVLIGPFPYHAAPVQRPDERAAVVVGPEFDPALLLRDPPCDGGEPPIEHGRQGQDIQSGC